MEFLSAPWWSALLAIILIDLVLAGDNAIVIALAARSLPAHLQKRAIVWGTAGAIVVRSLMTMAVVWLLKIPGLMLLGGRLGDTYGRKKVFILGVLAFTVSSLLCGLALNPEMLIAFRALQGASAAIAAPTASAQQPTVTDAHVQELIRAAALRAGQVRQSGPAR